MQEARCARRRLGELRAAEAPRRCAQGSAHREPVPARQYLLVPSWPDAPAAHGQQPGARAWSISRAAASSVNAHLRGDLRAGLEAVQMPLPRNRVPGRCRNGPRTRRTRPGQQAAQLPSRSHACRSGLRGPPNRHRASHRNRRPGALTSRRSQSAVSSATRWKGKVRGRKRRLRRDGGEQLDRCRKASSRNAGSSSTGRPSTGKSHRPPGRVDATPGHARQRERGHVERLQMGPGIGRRAPAARSRNSRFIGCGNLGAWPKPPYWPSNLPRRSCPRSRRQRRAIEARRPPAPG